MITLEVRRGSETQPLAIRTALGWTLLGSNSDTINQNELYTTAKFNLFPFLTRISIGVLNFGELNHSVVLSKERFPDLFKIKARLEHLKQQQNTGKRYEISMLWRCENPVLPYNRVLAEMPLEDLEKKFRRDGELATAYVNIINGYLEKGYARKLSPDEAKSKPEKTCYLPHHPVQAKHKKLRVVFNAAAKFHGTSLNYQLVTGPDLLNNLGVLTRFRSEKIALLADVESMFHQV